jgi:hypothetical protein
VAAGRGLFNQICASLIGIALLARLRHTDRRKRKRMNPKSRIPLKPLETGQVWRMENSHLHVDLVGKHLVHYKLIKHEAKRTPMSISNKQAVQKYLKGNKAVLVQG